MKIGFFEVEKKWERDYFKEKLKRHKLSFYEDELDLRNASKVKDVDALGIFVCSEITKELLDKLPKLKLICTMSTGLDHIDLEACKKRRIKVLSVPHYGENTVAEHTFALILALSRKLIQACEKARKGDFDPEGLTGFDLKDKTIGVIGVGHIGQHVVKMAKGFEMKVIGCMHHRNERLAKKFGFKNVNLENLLKKSDVITLHVPLNPGTEHMINKKNINLIKKGAILVNTSRGGLIETEAILKGLSNGRLSGVGLDVLEEENFIREEKELLSKKFKGKVDLRTVLENHVLMKHPKVIVTPHNAFNTKEALIRIIDTTVKNFKK